MTNVSMDSVELINTTENKERADHDMKRIRSGWVPSSMYRRLGTKGDKTAS